MTKILFLQLLPILSGVQNFMLHLIDGMPRETPDGYEIFVASMPGPDLENELQKRHITHIPIPSFRREISIHDLFALIHLIFVIKKYRFDIVHTNSSKPGFLGRIAAKICGVPLIVHTEHGTAFQEDQSPLKQRFYMLFEALANLLSDRVVFVNNSDREKCIKLGIIPPEKAITIYNALPHLKRKELETIAASRIYSVDGKITIGSALRFWDQKNIIQIVISACKICKQTENLRFILVGDGEHYDLCKSIVHSHGLNSRILLPGWDSDIGKWLKVFDLFMLYSRWEALPISIIEAMHSGLAVLGSDLPGICELVDESCGYIAPLASPQAFEEMLLYISRHPEELQTKGRKAVHTIQNKCSFDAMVKGYSGVYKKCPAS